MQKNAPQDLRMNMPLAAQTIKVGGAGSGLAVCTPIFERHVGKVWIESESGKGAAFFFALAA